MFREERKEFIHSVCVCVCVCECVCICVLICAIKVGETKQPEGLHYDEHETLSAGSVIIFENAFEAFYVNGFWCRRRVKGDRIIQIRMVKQGTQDHCW